MHSYQEKHNAKVKRNKIWHAKNIIFVLFLLFIMILILVLEGKFPTYPKNNKICLNVLAYMYVHILKYGKYMYVHVYGRKFYFLE